MLRRIRRRRYGNRAWQWTLGTWLVPRFGILAFLAAPWIGVIPSEAFRVAWALLSGSILVYSLIAVRVMHRRGLRMTGWPLLATHAASVLFLLFGRIDLAGLVAFGATPVLLRLLRGETLSLRRGLRLVGQLALATIPLMGLPTGFAILGACAAIVLETAGNEVGAGSFWRRLAAKPTRLQFLSARHGGHEDASPRLVALCEAEEWTAALQEVDDMVARRELTPHEAREEKAVILLAMGRFGDVLELAAEPVVPQAEVLLAASEAHAAVRQFDLARQRAEQAAEAGAEAGYAHGRVLEAEGRWQEAADLYDEILHRLGDRESIVRLAECMVQLGDYREARWLYSQALLDYPYLHFKLLVNFRQCSVRVGDFAAVALADRLLAEAREVEPAAIRAAAAPAVQAELL